MEAQPDERRRLIDEQSTLVKQVTNEMDAEAGLKKRARFGWLLAALLLFGWWRLSSTRAPSVVRLDPFEADVAAQAARPGGE